MIKAEQSYVVYMSDVTVKYRKHNKHFIINESTRQVIPQQFGPVNSDAGFCI